MTIREAAEAIQERARFDIKLPMSKNVKNCINTIEKELKKTNILTIHSRDELKQYAEKMMETIERAEQAAALYQTEAAICRADIEGILNAAIKDKEAQ